MRSTDIDNWTSAIDADYVFKAAAIRQMLTPPPKRITRPLTLSVWTRIKRAVKSYFEGKAL